MWIMKEIPNEHKERLHKDKEANFFCGAFSLTLLILKNALTFCERFLMNRRQKPKCFSFIPVGYCETGDCNVRLLKISEHSSINPNIIERTQLGAVEPKLRSIQSFSQPAYFCHWKKMKF